MKYILSTKQSAVSCYYYQNIASYVCYIFYLPLLCTVEARCSKAFPLLAMNGGDNFVTHFCSMMEKFFEFERIS